MKRTPSIATDVLLSDQHVYRRVGPPPRKYRKDGVKVRHVALVDESNLAGEREARPGERLELAISPAGGDGTQFACSERSRGLLFSSACPEWVLPSLTHGRRALSAAAGYLYASGYCTLP